MDLGHKIAYAADAEVIHVHDEGPKQTYNRYRREAIALKRIYQHERFHLWDFVRLFTANVINDYRHALRARVLRSNILGIFRFRLMQFWGTFRGFSQSGAITNNLKQTFYYPNRRVTNPKSAASRTESMRRIEYADDTAEHHVDGGS